MTTMALRSMNLPEGQDAIGIPASLTARLAAIIKARNARALAEADIVRPRPLGWRLTVSAYIQTDPRGAALYIIRPDDVPEGKNFESYYNRGICVY
jgi:hypothetical protein